MLPRKFIAMAYAVSKLKVYKENLINYGIKTKFPHTSENNLNEIPVKIHRLGEKMK